MGKRSDFKKIEKDFYPTPYSAVVPLAPFLPQKPFSFAEPCAGDARLVGHLAKATGGLADCLYACDVAPASDSVAVNDATKLDASLVNNCDLIITNPPWTRRKESGHLLHKIIENLSELKPTWLLFDSDWLQTAQAEKYIDRLVACVVVGRVKWIENSKHTGKDNCQWYLFYKDARSICEAPVIYGKGKKPTQIITSLYNNYPLSNTTKSTLSS
jgi:hypothetical protein